ncbi:MAG: phospholipase [Candidatus Symbiothrix sp.]|jgi:hypothetical protein|nr:phospholipase [Candidatus Symbiothrix sp.]
MKLKNLFASEPEPRRDPFSSLDSEVCCGKHIFCQKDLLLKAARHPVEYYDDEELDEFKNRPSDSYTEEETGQFAEILHTLWESDVPGWICSLQLRGIELPDELKDEVLLMLEANASY